MEKEDILFLSQLMGSLKDSREKLEQAHEKKDYNEFRNIKRLMINIQKQIERILKR